MRHVEVYCACASLTTKSSSPTTPSLLEFDIPRGACESSMQLLQFRAGRTCVHLAIAKCGFPREWRTQSQRNHKRALSSRQKRTRGARVRGTQNVNAEQRGARLAKRSCQWLVLCYRRFRCKEIQQTNRALVIVVIGQAVRSTKAICKLNEDYSMEVTTWLQVH